MERIGRGGGSGQGVGGRAAQEKAQLGGICPEKVQENCNGVVLQVLHLGQQSLGRVKGNFR